MSRARTYDGWKTTEPEDASEPLYWYAQYSGRCDNCQRAGLDVCTLDDSQVEVGADRRAPNETWALCRQCWREEIER